MQGTPFPSSAMDYLCSGASYGDRNYELLNDLTQIYLA
jgi:hypothetical protein